MDIKNQRRGCLFLKCSYLIQVSGSNFKTNTLFVNESSLYSLILSPKLPQAKAFKRWMMLGVAMAIQECGTAALDYFAMLKGWGLLFEKQS